MTTSVLSNSLQEEDNTLQNNLNTNNKSNLEIKGDISDDAIFEGATNVKLTPDVSEEVEIKEVEDNDDWMFEDADEVAEPSALEKLEYGWDKNTMVFFDALDIGYNYLTSLFDPDKTMKDIAIEREAERVENFNKEHWKMLSGKHDGVYTFLGEAATYILDPYYIAGYYFGSPLLKSPIGSMILNAGLLGGDEFIDQLAKKGEIESWGRVGKSAAIGGGIGLVMPVGAKLISKYLPKSIKDKASEVANFIDNKIAQRNNMTLDELKAFREIAKTKKVKDITNKLDKLVITGGWSTKANNFSAPLANAKKAFWEAKSKLAKDAFDINVKRKKILEPLKDTKKKFTKKQTKKITDAAKAEGKKILDLRQQIKDSRVAWKKTEQRLIERQTKKLNKYYKLEGERIAAILEELELKTGMGGKFLKAVLANLTRPLVGGATGGAANVGAGVMGYDVEDDFWTWVGAGSALGFAQKSIQNSKAIPLGDKKKYLKFIDSHAVQFTFQKLREITAGTTVTKLASFGGASEKIGRLLLRQVDDPLAEKSAIAQAESMERYFMRKASELIKNSTPEEQGLAISINRGNTELAKTASPKVKELASNLKGWLDEFKVLYNKSGFYSPRELDNYFPRVLNWAVINQDRTKAINILTDIFKNNYKLTTEQAKKRATTYLERSEGGVPSSVFDAGQLEKFIMNFGRGTPRKKGADFVNTPISDHITKNRSLQGEYKIVEEVLEKNNLLINDLSIILPKIVQDSVKSIAFARTFGKGGQLLKPLLTEIQKKYADLNLKNESLGLFSNRQQAMKHEISKVLDTVDAYFGRHGMDKANSFKTSVGILTMLSNLNMLGRVTITSLGDIIQPFQNSLSWTAAIKGLGRTNLFKASWEKGMARNLNYDIVNYANRALQRGAAAGEKEIILNSSWMGKWGTRDTTSTINSVAFKALGLEWLTGYARRFAYNTGSADAFNLSRQLYKLKDINSKAGLQIQRDLAKYGITKNQALTIGKYNNFKSAAQDKSAFKSLNEAGLTASNRDALIPQESNRLLFTQSKTPYIRMLGQFLSWSQAKSAQTNKILSRIENGDARTLIKILATLPVYGGIQQLREYAKHGDVITDAEYNGGELMAKGWQLSGMPGWLSDMVFNRFVGPGSFNNSPFFVFAPALNIAKEIGFTITEAMTGRGDDALKRLDKRILPLPEWRNWVQKFWFPKTGSVSTKGSTPKLSFAYGGIVQTRHGSIRRKKYNEGDIVASPLVLNEIKKDVGLIKPKEKPFLPNKEADKVIIGGGVDSTNNETEVYKALKKHNLSDEAVAGIMGNIAIETGYTFNHIQEERNGKGYGLFQFTDNEKTGEGHLNDYRKYLIDNNVNDSIQSQVDYVMDNINNKKGYDIGDGNRDTIQKIFATGKAAEVAGIFHDLFERPQEGSRYKRQTYANTIRTKFHGGGSVSHTHGPKKPKKSSWKSLFTSNQAYGGPTPPVQSSSSSSSSDNDNKEKYIASTQGGTNTNNNVTVTSDDSNGGDTGVIGEVGKKVIKKAKDKDVKGRWRTNIPIPPWDTDTEMIGKIQSLKSEGPFFEGELSKNFFSPTLEGIDGVSGNIYGTAGIKLSSDNPNTIYGTASNYNKFGKVEGKLDYAPDSNELDATGTFTTKDLGLLEKTGGKFGAKGWVEADTETGLGYGIDIEDKSNNSTWQIGSKDDEFYLGKKWNFKSGGLLDRKRLK